MQWPGFPCEQQAFFSSARGLLFDSAPAAVYTAVYNPNHGQLRVHGVLEVQIRDGVLVLSWSGVANEPK